MWSSYPLAQGTLKLSSFSQLPTIVEFISFASRNLKALKQQFLAKP
jgi:hypothetical protein